MPWVGHDDCICQSWYQRPRRTRPWHAERGVFRRTVRLVAYGNQLIFCFAYWLSWKSIALRRRNDRAQTSVWSCGKPSSLWWLISWRGSVQSRDETKEGRPSLQKLPSVSQSGPTKRQADWVNGSVLGAAQSRATFGQAERLLLVVFLYLGPSATLAADSGSLGVLLTSYFISNSSGSVRRSSRKERLS